MDTKMSYKSKRLAIIVAVIVVLIVAISIGTYYFIKGNDNAQATYTGNEQVANNGESETAGNSEEQINSADEQNNEGDVNQGEEDSQEPTNLVDNTDDDTETTPGTTTGGNNNVTTNDDDNNDGNIPNEEYTQTDIVETEVERVEQEVRVGWSNIALASAGISTNITTSKPDLTLEKTATVVNSLNENDNAVQIGSKIKYEITVTNNSESIEAIGVNVSDVIPSGTVLDTESEISNGGVENNGRVSWVIDVARNSSVTVSFTVVVKNTDGEDTINEINNTAIVDGKNTPETVNPIIETSKTATSTSEVLEAGTTVTYSIKVSNTGTTDAVTTVSDTVPVGTSFVAGSIKINGESYYTINGGTVDLTTKTADDLSNGFVVSIPAGETVELKFDVTINEFYGESTKISNIAVVGDTDTEEEEITAYNPVMDLTKEANPAEVAEGETITYTLTVTNSGKVDGIAIIKDSIPVGTDFVAGSIKVNGESSCTIKGEIVDLTTKTADDLANGIQVNVEKNGGTTTVSFQVTVRVNSGLTDSIKNTAFLVGKNEDGTPTETPTGETETEVKAYIVFVENGGTEVNDIEGYAGDAITDTTMPTTTRTGYTFEGWYADEALTNKVEVLPDTMKAGTTYYYAKWEARTDLSYTVNYLEKDTEKVLATPKVVDGQTYGREVTENAIEIEGYNKVEPTTATITIEVDNNVINFYYTLAPSLTLTKTALDEDKNSITDGYVYEEDENNYIYYRLKVENKGPKAVENQVITDTLPFGMTYISEGNNNISAETITEQEKSKTKITWNIDRIEAYNSVTVDIKVKIDERVFEGVDQVEDSEYNVISDIVAKSPENTDREYQTTDKTGKVMSLFVRFASPVSGNSGYLYAGTTTAAESGMPTADNDVYVQKYNGSGSYNDAEVNANLSNAQSLANMLDDFYKANTDGTIASYVDGNRLPNEAEIKEFLENEYNITLDSSHTILWYKVSERAGEKARIRRYDITNRKTGQNYTQYVNMSACTYHLDGIIVDINSFNKIPDGSDINIRNTANVRTTDITNWLNTEDFADVTIYYNTRPITKTLTTNSLSKPSSTINASNVENTIRTIETTTVEDEETTKTKDLSDSSNEAVEKIEDNNKEKTEITENTTEQLENTEIGNTTEQLENTEVGNNTEQLENTEVGNTIDSSEEKTTEIENEDIVDDSKTIDENIIEEEISEENIIQNIESNNNFEENDNEIVDIKPLEYEQVEKKQSISNEILDE